MALDSVEKPVMMITRQVGLVAPRFADDGQAVHARHLEIGDEQIVRDTAACARARVRPSGATSTSYSSLSDSVFSSRSRMLASSSTTSTRLRVGPAAGRAAAAGAGAAWRGAAARPLAVEPRVDVALAEPPLPADAHRGNLAGLDEAVDRSQVHLEVLEDLLGGEKRLVH